MCPFDCRAKVYKCRRQVIVSFESLVFIIVLHARASARLVLNSGSCLKGAPHRLAPLWTRNWTPVRVSCERTRIIPPLLLLLLLMTDSIFIYNCVPLWKIAKSGKEITRTHWHCVTHRPSSLSWFARIYTDGRREASVSLLCVRANKWVEARHLETIHSKC